MKASGYTDAEVARAVGVSTKELLDVVGADDYVKSVWEQASERVATEIERKFLESVFDKLESGDTADAKWYLERRSGKYQKKESLDVNVQSIDDIIRAHGKIGGE